MIDGGSLKAVRLGQLRSLPPSSEQDDLRRDIQGGFEMRRMLLVVTVMTMLALPMSVALSTPAGAVTPALSRCNKVGGNINNTVTFTGKKCSTKAPHGYGNLTVPGIDLLTGAPFQWTNGDYVELDSPFESVDNGQAGCKHNWSNYYVQGPVSATSGDAYDQAVTGDDYFINVCINNSSGAVKDLGKAPSLSFNPPAG
jgi:hypothetical protein